MRTTAIRNVRPAYELPAVAGVIAASAPDTQITRIPASRVEISSRARFLRALQTVALTILSVPLASESLGSTAIIAWGNNVYGQTNVPANLTNAVAVAAGAYHNLALKDDGTIVAWGQGTFGQTNVPANLTNAVAIARGWNHSLALKGDKTVIAWGQNDDHQTNVPPNLTNVVAVAGGGQFSLALKADKTVVAWGANLEGQTNIPPNLTNLVAIAGGGFHGLALKADKTVVAWGRNLEGQTNVPPNLTNAVAIAAGDTFSLALKEDKTVIAWGNNLYGQTNVPPNATNVVEISAGAHHALALKADKTIIAWGRNNFSQTNIPSGLADVMDIAGGGYHNLALVPGPASPPCTTPTISTLSSKGGGLTFSFTTQTGFTYDLEYKTALTDPLWNVLQTVLASSSLTTVTDSPLQSSRRFYRVACRGQIPAPVTPYEPPQPPLAQPSSSGGCSAAAADDSLPYLFSGEFHHTVKDLVIKGRGMDFVWARTYRSKSGANSAAGNGWVFSYDIRAVPNGPDFDVYDGTGRKDTYRLQTNGTYAASQLFCEGTLSNNVFRLQFPDTGLWEFAPLDGSASQGKISRITDRNNNTCELSYSAPDPWGLLIMISVQGRTSFVSYNADGYVSTITDFSGRQVSYTYYQNGDAGGSAGDLKSVTSPIVTNTPNGNDFPAGKTVTYTYSKGFADDRLNHNLLTITDAKGQTWLRNTYASTTNSADLNFDRLVSQTRGYSNQVLTFCYRPQSPSSGNGFAITKAIVNDQVGNVSEHFFDATNRPVLLRQFTGRAVPKVTTTDTQNRPSGKLRPADPAYFDVWWFWDDNSNLVSTRYPNGNSVSIVYEASLNPNASLRSRGNLRARTTLPGPLGGDQAAITETFVYDTTFGCSCGFNFATQATDGRGNTTFHSYDSHGNRTNTMHAVPSAVEDFEYNSYGQMTAHVLPDNGSGYRRRDVMEYYNSGPQTGYLRRQIVDSLTLALTTTYEYDAVGNVIRTIDPSGNDSTNIVNQLNQVVREISHAVTTSNGVVRYQRDFAYDANNNPVSVNVLNLDGSGLLSTNAYLTITSAYDILNRLTNVTQEVDPSHNVTTQYAYDARGNRSLVVSGEASNGHQPNNTVATLYDERNLQYREIRAPGDPAQSTTQFDYDANGNLIRTSQGLEDVTAPRITTHVYDGFNRRTATTDAMGNATTTHYDANGNAISSRVDGELTDVTGGAGNVRLSESSSSYDAMNRLVQTDQAFFDTITGTNIAGGHALTTTIYSPASQVLATIDANNHTNRVTYDTVGRQIVVTDAKGNTTTFGYDADGNILATMEVDLSDLGSPSRTYSTTHAYDGLNRLIQTSDNLGNQMRYEYDSRNNRVTLTDPRGNVTLYAYDGINRLTATTRYLTSNGQGNGTPVGTITTRQTWDDNSRLTGQTDANTNTTASIYDPLGRLIATVFADGTTNATTYDVHDNATVTTDANGNIVTTGFDLLNRTIAKSIVRGPGVLGTTNEAYQYDGLSRLVSAQNTDSVVTRRYDSLSHVTRETQQVASSGAPARTVVSTYDAEGNRLSCIYPGGRVVNCTYDALNRKQNISDLSGGIASYYFFGPALVERRDYANGTRALYGYDGVRRMANSYQNVIVGNIPIDSRAYTWDAAGNKTTDHDFLAPSLDSRSFTYDSVNRMVTSRTAVVGPTNTYVFDSVGNRLSVTGENAGSYFMNPTIPPADFQMNQYTTTPFDSRTYDADGNIVGAGAQQFYYDYRNRLVGVWQPVTTNSITFKYDCLGRRIEKSASDAATRFYYADWQEIEEQSNTNTTLASYTWGNRIDELLAMAHGGQDFFYHADDLGSVHKVTDVLGGVVEQYRYADYGEPSFFDGTNGPLVGTQIGNDTLFTGRRFDPETGLCYYRTRYLDQRAGRFMTRDTIGTWGDDANAGNGFAYVGNNPAGKGDALGMMAPSAAGSASGGRIPRCFWYIGGRWYGFWGQTFCSIPAERERCCSGQHFVGDPACTCPRNSISQTTSGLENPWIPREDSGRDVALNNQAGTPARFLDWKCWFVRCRPGQTCVDGKCVGFGGDWNPTGSLEHFSTFDIQAGQTDARDSIGIWGDAANLGNGYTYVNNSPLTSADPMGEWKFFGTERGWSGDVRTLTIKPVERHCAFGICGGWHFSY